MTFDRLAALQAEWKIRPPAHWLLASFVGYKPKKDKRSVMRGSKALDDGSEPIQSMLREFRSGVIR